MQLSVFPCGNGFCHCQAGGFCARPTPEKAAPISKSDAKYRRNCRLVAMAECLTVMPALLCAAYNSTVAKSGVWKRLIFVSGRRVDYKRELYGSIPVKPNCPPGRRCSNQASASASTARGSMSPTLSIAVRNTSSSTWPSEAILRAALSTASWIT